MVMACIKGSLNEERNAFPISVIKCQLTTPEVILVRVTLPGIKDFPERRSNRLSNPSPSISCLT